MIQPRQDLRNPCLHAASRKIAIASFHLRELFITVGTYQPLPNEAPIPVQAHFEGVLYAYVAASDQLERVVRTAMRPNRRNIPNDLPGWERFKIVVRALGDTGLREDLLAWADDAFFADARSVRNLATHAHYEKQHPHLGLPAIGDWKVQAPGGPRPPPPYPGPRYLRDYGQKAVNHLDRLHGIMLSLDRFLSQPAKRGTSDPAGVA